MSKKKKPFWELPDEPVEKESVVETIEPSNGYKVLKAVTFARVFYSPGEMIVCSPEQADLLRSVGAID